jgi:hypothetical protein
MSRAARFTQADVERLIRAAKKLGLTVTGVEVTSEGKPRVLTGEPAESPMSALDRWRASRAQRPA